MKHYSTLSVLAIAGVMCVSTPLARAQAPACDWSGKWTTELGELTLTQNGYTLSGRFNNNFRYPLTGKAYGSSGSCKAEVTIAGRNLDAGYMKGRNWELEGDRFGGPVRDMIPDDGQTITYLSGHKVVPSAPPVYSIAKPTTQSDIAKQANVAPNPIYQMHRDTTGETLTILGTETSTAQARAKIKAQRPVPIKGMSPSSSIISDSTVPRRNYGKTVQSAGETVDQGIHTAEKTADVIIDGAKYAGRTVGGGAINAGEAALEVGRKVEGTAMDVGEKVYNQAGAAGRELERNAKRAESTAKNTAYDLGYNSADKDLLSNTRERKTHARRGSSNRTGTALLAARSSRANVGTGAIAVDLTGVCKVKDVTPGRRGIQVFEDSEVYGIGWVKARVFDKTKNKMVEVAPRSGWANPKKPNDLERVWEISPNGSHLILTSLQGFNPDKLCKDMRMQPLIYDFSAARYGYRDFEDLAADSRNFIDVMVKLGEHDTLSSNDELGVIRRKETLNLSDVCKWCEATLSEDEFQDAKVGRGGPGVLLGYNDVTDHYAVFYKMRPVNFIADNTPE